MSAPKSRPQRIPRHRRSWTCLCIESACGSCSQAFRMETRTLWPSPICWRHHWFCWEHHRKSPFLIGKPSINGPFNRLSPTFCWCEFHVFYGASTSKYSQFPTNPTEYGGDHRDDMVEISLANFFGQNPKKTPSSYIRESSNKKNYELSLIWSRNMIPSGYVI